MLALVVARPGPVRDGLVALLGALPDVRQIVQVAQADDAWEFAQSTCPEITLIHASSLSANLSDFILKVKSRCSSPLLIITTNEGDRQTAVVQGADIAVLEGLPSAKLTTYITILLQGNRNVNSSVYGERDMI